MTKKSQPILNKKQKKVCVIGLGHIGLPTACVLAMSGYDVLGVDIDKKVVMRTQLGESIYIEPNLHDLLIKTIKNKSLKVSINIASADIYIIAVPTPLTPDNQPDLSYVNAVIDTIKPHLRSHDLILLESTCPIGTTHKIARELEKVCPDVYVAYCPERVFPGNILYELIQNDRVVGGVNDASTVKAMEFYQSFTCGDIVATDVRTAEAVKLAENVYRDINIAYANELSMIADRLNLNIKELILLANKHPRVQILNPGIGVGGHCIAVDPWFMIASAPDLAILTSKARDVNAKKTNWIIQKVRDAIKENQAKVVVCLGLTYKPNVSDIRESPALIVVETLEREIEVLRVDPYVPNTQILYDAIARADIIVGLVAHSGFFSISPNLLEGKIVLDFAGIFK